MPNDFEFPRVTLHYAQTVDGRIATSLGESRWISGDGTLTFAHELRASHEGILVGVGTVLQDDPLLTVRLVEATDPLRIIVDSTLRTPLGANVLKNGAAEGTILAVTKRAPADRVTAARKLGARILVLQSDSSGKVDLSDLLHRLTILGVKSLLVEGGSGIITSFLQQRLAHRLVVCIAPKMIGRGADAVGDLGIIHLADALHLAEMKVEKVGDDLLIDARVGPEKTALLAQHQSIERAKAVWFVEPRRVELREEPVPVLGKSDVLIRAQFSAISHGTEMLVYRGEVLSSLAVDLPTIRGSFGFPIKYGYATVGTVEKAGESVRNLAEGDRVFVLHPHQSRFVVPSDYVTRLPSALSPEAGLFTANLETALNVLLDAPIRLSEAVIIFGQGVVGLLLTQLAKRAGAGKVIAVDPYPRRRELARQLGADITISPEEVTSDYIRSITDDRGADIVYEASGAPIALQQALNVVAVQGSVIAISWYGNKPVPLDLGGEFHRSRLKIVSSQVGNIDPALAPRWDRERRSEVVKELLGQLQLTKLITHHFPLRSAAEAYRLIDERPEETVQVVFTYD